MLKTTPPSEVTKPIHTLILDSSPLLLNIPGVSTLLASGHVLVTTPSVLAEIKNEEARLRVDTLYKPFLELRSPRPESIKFVKDFARKTGDAAVLSQPDFEILALAYELECERNKGDWRLRNSPGQKRVNGSPPEKPAEDQSQLENKPHAVSATGEQKIKSITDGIGGVQLTDEGDKTKEQPPSQAAIEGAEEQPLPELVVEEDSADSDEGWITPTNIKRQQAKDDSQDKTSKTQPKTLQVATMTGDFAMQNVLLQINLNLLSTKTCQRITQIKQFVLRCHACFSTCKDMSKQFCPRCGKPTLTRVTCTTNDKGEVRLHLKANMQWNNRGNVYSIPKATAGSANQKWKGQGGGKAGWGNDLILAEDQKEYIRAMTGAKKAKSKDLMDEDILPSILTGDRDQGGGRPRIGAGRNVNSRKR